MSRVLIISGVFLLLCSHSIQAELRDPTRPPDYVNKDVGDINDGALELSLTLVSANHKVVVMNGQSLRVGDKIGANQITRIESNSVQLVGPNGNITLFLLGKSVKQAVQQSLL